MKTMAGKPVEVIAGAWIGIGPTVFLTGAATQPEWMFIGALMMLFGAMMAWRGDRQFAMGVAGIMGGLAIALANLFYPIGPQAFPGGPGVTWLAAMLMFGGGTPILHPVHREHAQLRALVATSGVAEPSRDE